MATVETGTSNEEVVLPAHEWRQVVSILKELRRKRSEENLSQDQLDSIFEEEVAKLPQDNERLIKALRDQYIVTLGQLVDRETEMEAEAEEAELETGEDAVKRLGRIKDGLRANLSGRVVLESDQVYFDSKINDLQPGDKWAWIMTKINRLPMKGQAITEAPEARVYKIKTSLRTNLGLRDKTKVDSVVIQDLAVRINDLQPEDEYGWRGILEDIVKLPLATDPANATGPVKGADSPRNGDFKRLTLEELSKLSASEITDYRKRLEEHVRGKNLDATDKIDKKPVVKDTRPQPDSRPFGDGERAKIQANLIEALDKSDAGSNRQKILDAIAKVTNEKRMRMVNDQIYKLPQKKDDTKDTDTDKGKKVEGKRGSDSARIDPDLVIFEEDGVRRVRKKVTHGRGRYVEHEMRDVSDEVARRHLEAFDRMEADKKRQQEAAAERARQEVERIEAEKDARAKEVMSRSMYADSSRIGGDQYDSQIDTVAARTDVVQAAAASQPRTFVRWLRDFISGTDSRAVTEPTHQQQLLDKALNDPSEYKTPEQRRYGEMIHQLTVQAERTTRDTQERGLTSRMGRVADYLKKFGHGAIIGVGVATIIGLAGTALFASGGVAWPSLAVLAGAAMGNGSREMSRKYFENNNYKHPKIYSALIGVAMGLGTTAIADRVLDAFTATPSRGPGAGKAAALLTPDATPAASSSLSWLSPYAVQGGDAVARHGLDGFMNSQMFNTPLFQSLKLSTLGHDQMIEAVRAVFTDNPQFAQKFTGAAGRIVEGADGLDLLFTAGDRLDPSVMKSSRFLDCLFKEITSGDYRELVNNIGGKHKVASLIGSIK